jgi:acetate CoA/acetoacetate CoA-transferase alpha subunit
MIGRFLGVGSPLRIIVELVRQGRKNLTVIANDTARPGVGVGLLIAAKAVRKVVVSVAIIRRARELIVLRVRG